MCCTRKRVTDVIHLNILNVLFTIKLLLNKSHWNDNRSLVSRMPRPIYYDDEERDGSPDSVGFIEEDHPLQLHGNRELAAQAVKLLQVPNRPGDVSFASSTTDMDVPIYVRGPSSRGQGDKVRGGVLWLFGVFYFYKMHVYGRQRCVWYNRFYCRYRRIRTYFIYYFFIFSRPKYCSKVRCVPPESLVYFMVVLLFLTRSQKVLNWIGKFNHLDQYWNCPTSKN